MTAIDLRAIAPRHLAGDQAWSYPDGPAHLRLGVVLALNLLLVAGAFYAENVLWPWQARMDLRTPGWAMVLAQTVVLGFVAALTNRAGWIAVVLGLLAATLLAYAFFLAGTWLIDITRALQTAYLISRAVQLGLVGTIVLTLGVAVRLILRQRLALRTEPLADAVPQYCLSELMFLVAACSVGFGVLNLFAYDFEREDQVFALADSLLRALPGTLPWLWLVTQPRVTVRAIVWVFLATAGLAGAKIVWDHALTRQEASEILCDARLRAAAFTGGAVFNGLLLRALGFRWRRG
jgi:hypothetical protein